jgi:hypothetical protein
MVLNLEGRKCCACGKGKLRKVQDEVEPGIFVEAFKCGECRGIVYPQHVMEKVEALYRDKAAERSLIKVGASLAFAIPSEIVKRLGLKPKEKVFITSKGNEIIARVSQA